MRLTITCFLVIFGEILPVCNASSQYGDAGNASPQDTDTGKGNLKQELQLSSQTFLLLSLSFAQLSFSLYFSDLPTGDKSMCAGSVAAAH